MPYSMNEFVAIIDTGSVQSPPSPLPPRSTVRLLCMLPPRSLIYEEGGYHYQQTCSINDFLPVLVLL